MHLSEINNNTVGPGPTVSRYVCLEIIKIIHM